MRKSVALNSRDSDTLAPEVEGGQFTRSCPQNENDKTSRDRDQRWTSTTLANPHRIEGGGFSVTFLRNPACYPYLRETNAYLFIKNGLPNVSKFEDDGDHIVAYELPLNQEMLSGQHHRWCRVWKFNPQDPYFVPGVPCEAVRPCDIVPGKATPRYQPLWEDVVIERRGGK
jgi:hypothetical protein